MTFSDHFTMTNDNSPERTAMTSIHALLREGNGTPDMWIMLHGTGIEAPRRAEINTLG